MLEDLDVDDSEEEEEEKVEGKMGLVQAEEAMLVDLSLLPLFVQNGENGCDCFTQFLQSQETLLSWLYTNTIQQ